MTEAQPIGTVAALWRFPVKSMQGEQLDTAEVTPKGVVGDRAYAVIDVTTGKVASAKHPRKWSRLLECDARFVEEPTADANTVPPVRIALPDGTVVRSDESGTDDTLSKFFGTPVTLVSVAPAEVILEEVWPEIDGLAPAEFIAATKTGDEGGEPVSDVAMGLAAPKGTFYDLAVLHLLTNATLAELERFYPEGRFDVLRYRPNLVLDTVATGFVENDWPGQTLSVGTDLQVAVSLATMRCVMTTLAQGDLPQDRGLLRTIATHNRIEIPGLGHWACAGAYAGVAAPGRVEVGDPITIS